MLEEISKPCNLLAFQYAPVFCIVAVFKTVVTASAVVAVTAPILLLNVIQSADVNNPRLVDVAFGMLNVWVEPDELIVKSVPIFPVAKVCVEPVSPFKDLMVFPVNRFKRVTFLTVLSAGFQVRMESEIAPVKGYLSFNAGTAEL